MIITESEFMAIHPQWRSFNSFKALNLGILGGLFVGLVGVFIVEEAINVK
jgi:hypothetical protein